MGRDVVVILDSITRLARAYNLAIPASGRILSGGVDSAALYPPKKNSWVPTKYWGGGSLTVLRQPLMIPAPRWMRLSLRSSRVPATWSWSLIVIWPIVVSSGNRSCRFGTRNEDLLMKPDYQPLIWGVRLSLQTCLQPRATNALSRVCNRQQTMISHSVCQKAAERYGIYMGKKIFLAYATFYIVDSCLWIKGFHYVRSLYRIAILKKLLKYGKLPLLSSWSSWWSCGGVAGCHAGQQEPKQDAKKG